MLPVSVVLGAANSPLAFGLLAVAGDAVMKEPNNLQVCLDSAHGGPPDPLGDGSGLTVRGHAASVPGKTLLYWGISR